MKEKIKNGFNKVKTAAKEHKSKLIKGGAIIGGSALGLGILGAVMQNRKEQYNIDEAESALISLAELGLEEANQRMDSLETEESNED